MIVETTYDPAGRVLTVTEIFGSTNRRITRYEYDDLDRQTKVIRNWVQNGTGSPDENITQSITYDLVGRVLHQTDPNGNVVSFNYDQLDRLTTLSVPLPNSQSRITSTLYDGMGNIAKITDPAGNTTFTYDELYRQTTINTIPQTGVTLTSKTDYDAMDRVTIQTDAAGIQTRYWYDKIGRTTRVIENFQFGRPSNDPTVSDRNVETNYTYDEMGNVLTTRLPSGGVITETYDDLNRRVTSDGPLDGTVDQWTTQFDRGGRQVGLTAPNGATQTMVYDWLDRITNLNYTDATLPTPSTYVTPNVQFQYDAYGRLQTMLDGTGQTQYGYDAVDRITSVLTTSAADQVQKTVTYAYDPAGRRTGMTFDGKSVNYGYDIANRLTSVTDWDATTTDVGYKYDNADRLTEMTLPNGVLVMFVYDDISRLKQVKYQKSGQTLMQYDYTLDSVGNRTAVTETIQPATFLGPELDSPIVGYETNNTTPTFTWKPVTGDQGPYTYEIQVDNSPTFDTALEYTATGAGTTVTLTEALAENVYHWRVRAIDNQGKQSLWSDVWSFAIDLTPPAKPTNISPISAAIGAWVRTARPTFEWQPVEDAVEYEIQSDNNVILNSTTKNWDFLMGFRFRFQTI